MEVIFFGTSSGTPTKDRNVSAIAIRVKQAKNWCLVDCGEATQHQLLRSPLSLNKLDAICITHVHGDHCYGLPGLLASAGMSGRTRPLTIVGPNGIETMIRTIAEVSQLFLPFELVFVEVKAGLKIKLGDFQVLACQLSHRVDSFAYRFTEPAPAAKLDQEKLKAEGIPAGKNWGQLQSGEDVTLDNGTRLIAQDFQLPAVPPRRIIIAGDNDSPSLLAKHLESVQLLVHESTYTDEIAKVVGEGPQHSCARRVAKFAEEHQIPNLVLTHFSPRFQRNPEASLSILDIELEAKNCFRGNLFLADDFDCFCLGKNGTLTRRQLQT